MKCIYCNNDSELTVSDIIPYALTGAKLKKRFVCKKHNSFTNDNYEKQMIANLDIFRNRLGLAERDGDPVRYCADLTIGEYTIPNVRISDHSSILGNSKKKFRTTDKDGNTILIGDRTELLKIKNASNDKIKDIIITSISVVSRSNLQSLFTSKPVLHAVAKIAYEWHCYINDVESFDSQQYADIVSYILNPEAEDHIVEIVVDAQIWYYMDMASQTGSHMLFEYSDIDGNTYVVFSFWGVIIYKIKICKSESNKINEANLYTAYLYHVDGTENGAVFGVWGKPIIISEDCDQALWRLCAPIKERLSKFGERDLTKEYILSHVKTIQPLLSKYKNGACTIEKLLDYEHIDRVTPIYILEQISCNRQKYDTSETFTHNMQRILDCEDKFIFTEDKVKVALQRYINMDQNGTFATMLEEAIKFFQTI